MIPVKATMIEVGIIKTFSCYVQMCNFIEMGLSWPFFSLFSSFQHKFNGFDSLFKKVYFIVL